MTRGKAYMPGFRATVVAELVTGRSPSEVRREYGIPVRTLQTWLRESTSAWLERHHADVRETGELDLGALVAGLVEQLIGTLVARSRFTINPDWLAKQDAAGLAELSAVEYDRLIRLLHAFVPREAEPPPAGRVVEGTALPEGGNRDAEDP